MRRLSGNGRRSKLDRSIESGRKHEVLLDIENKGEFCVRGEVATGGRATPSDFDESRTQGLIVDPTCILWRVSGHGGREKEKRSTSS